MALTMRRWPHAALLAASCVVLGSATLGTDAQAAGLVEVSFVNPEKFADIGRIPADRQRALDGLQRHFKSLQSRLPDGQALKIEVLDVDLAGELQMVVSKGGDQRILTGRADWPRMTLEYTLTSDGKTLKSGRAELADMGYRGSSVAPPTMTSEALYYETRMIDRWFTQNFLPQ